jgi:hypothetical protein
MKDIGGWLLLALIIIGALVVLRWVVKLTFALWVPLLFIGIGIMAGVWWAKSRSRR